MNRPIMMCGHVANSKCSAKDGVVFDPAIPSCVICDCIEVDENAPDLQGRIARCAHCGKEAPSSLDLAFFEFRGEGSKEAAQVCKNCRFAKRAHIKEVMDRNPSLKCVDFIPHGPFEYDRYYCGCFGWD